MNTTVTATVTAAGVTATFNVVSSAEPQYNVSEERDKSSSTGSPALSSVWPDATAMVLRIAPAVLIPVGTVGNVLAIVLLRKLGTETSTLPLFFTALAVSDICLLYFGLLPVWLEYQFGYRLSDSHSVVCKLNFWALYSLGCLSAWLLVAMTIQRAASVVWPHKVSSTCTRRQAYVSIVAIVITTFLINSSLLYGLDIHPDFGVCFFTFPIKVLQAFLLLDLLMSSLLPFSLLLLSNSVLIWKVLQSLRAARARLHSGQTEQVDARQKKFMSMTVTLIAMSAAFIVLTSPIGLLSLESIKATIEKDFGMFLSTVANQLWYSNSTVNCFLYILTGTRFRQELKRLFGFA